MDIALIEANVLGLIVELLTVALLLCRRVDITQLRGDILLQLMFKKGKGNLQRTLSGATTGGASLENKNWHNSKRL